MDKKSKEYKEFRKRLRLATKIVKSWPKWKQKAVREASYVEPYVPWWEKE